MVKLREHPVRWQSPHPLWGRFGGDPAEAAAAPDQARPAILRFATDEFMEQLLGTLERNPAGLDTLIARPESWRAQAADPTDLVERTPVPRHIRDNARKSLAGRLRSAVRATVAEADVVEQARTVRRPLKLYQPAHQRFYLVGASLVCGVAGFPERAVNRGGPEKLSFVIRRLLPATSAADPAAPLHEHAYVKAEGARWQRVDAGGDVARQVPGEELHPVFPMAFAEAERTRTLWAGLIPVGRREEFVTAAVDRTPATSLAAGQRFAVSPPLPAAPAPSKQARLARFQMEVAEPWKNLIRTAVSTAGSLAEKAAEEAAEEPLLRRARVFDLNLRQQQTSWLVLLDFADFLAAYLPDVWDAIRSGGTGADQLPQQRHALYQWLGTATMSLALRNGLKAADADPAIRASSVSLREALRSIAAAGVRDKLEAVELTYVRSPASLTNSGWPPFHFVLAGLGTAGQADGPYTFLANLPTATEVEADPLGGPDAARTHTDRVDGLTALVGRALEATPETDVPPVPFAMQLRNALSATSGDAGWFVIRFVYDCRDCGPLHPPVVSEPTQRFQLASFFDPDAPARPIRINLPLDTSPAGLRRYNRNTAFIVSDMLCGQIQRAKGLGLGELIRSVLPWPLHKSLDLGIGGSCSNGSGLSIGMICSLSIPIITICALILLMIIVSLLDIVFRWIPYFVMCFPVPGLKGKRG
jgi:hypothetical protein